MSTSAATITPPTAAPGGAAAPAEQTPAPYVPNWADRSEEELRERQAAIETSPMCVVGLVDRTTSKYVMRLVPLKVLLGLDMDLKNPLTCDTEYMFGGHDSDKLPFPGHISKLIFDDFGNGDETLEERMEAARGWAQPFLARTAAADGRIIALVDEDEPVVPAGEGERLAIVDLPFYPLVKVHPDVLDLVLEYMREHTVGQPMARIVFPLELNYDTDGKTMPVAGMVAKSAVDTAICNTSFKNLNYLVLAAHHLDITNLVQLVAAIITEAAMNPQRRDVLAAEVGTDDVYESPMIEFPPTRRAKLEATLQRLQQ